jgi:hypothetical protein
MSEELKITAPKQERHCSINIAGGNVSADVRVDTIVFTEPRKARFVLPNVQYVTLNIHKINMIYTLPFDQIVYREAFYKIRMLQALLWKYRSPSAPQKFLVLLKSEESFTYLYIASYIQQLQSSYFYS